MPASAMASSTQSRPSATFRTRSATSPSLVNLQALLKRLSRICLSRMESAVSAPRFSCASITSRFLFFSTSCPVVRTSSICATCLVLTILARAVPGLGATGPHLLGQPRFAQPVKEMVVVLRVLERDKLSKAGNAVFGLEAHSLGHFRAGLLKVTHSCKGRSEQDATAGARRLGDIVAQER